MQETNRRKAILFSGSLILLFALLLTACNGSADANGETVGTTDLAPASVEVEALEEEQTEAAEEAEAEIASDDEAVSETSSDENAESVVEAAEPVARVVPQFGLGDPQLKSSSAGEFDRYGEGVKVLEFFAYWCPTCKALAPKIHGLEAAYSGEVEFTFLDIDDPVNEALKQEYGFYYQPYVLVIDQDGVVQRFWVGGGIEPSEIQAEIERLIAAQG